MPYAKPRPRIALAVECAVDELPPMNAVIGDDGVDGSALEAEEETMTGLDVAMTPGAAYWVTSPDGDLFRVEAAEGARCPEVRVRLDASTSPPARLLEYATAVAARLSELTGGTIRDEITGHELDARAPQHVVVETADEPDGVWLRTRGLVKFGQPELEVYGVAREDREAAEEAIRRVAAHIADRGDVAPGATLGVGDVRLVAREGERNRDRWGDTVVLELVDVDVLGHALEAGRSLGRRDWLR